MAIEIETTSPECLWQTLRLQVRGPGDEPFCPKLSDSQGLALPLNFLCFQLLETKEVVRQVFLLQRFYPVGWRRSGELYWQLSKVERKSSSLVCWPAAFVARR